MKLITLRSTVVIVCAVVVSLVGVSSWANCPVLIGPICSASAGLRCSNSDTTPCATDSDCGGGFCNSTVIFGTPSPNGANVTSITTDSAHLLITTSGLNTPTASFRVHWDGIGISPFTGNVTATNANGSCVVPVTYTNNAALPNNNVICIDGAYTFKVLSAPFWGSGQTACASHQYTCGGTDGSPPLDSIFPHPLLDFPTPTRLFSVSSPIHATPGQRDVTMELEKAGAFDGHLRLVFARSTNQGATYSAFTDATTQVLAGSTRIIGTGEWSSVRAAVAVSPNNYPVSSTNFPAMSEWGRLLLALLMFSALGWFSWRYGTMSRRASP